MWHVTEELLEGKYGDDRCEDVIVNREGLYAVIDGVSDKSGLEYRWNGVSVTSGRFAADVVAEVLRTIDVAASPTAIIDALSLSLNVAITDQRPGLPAHQRPIAQVVIANTHRGEVFAVGDCQCAWATSGEFTFHNGTKRIDRIAGDMRAAVLDASALSGSPFDGYVDLRTSGVTAHADADAERHLARLLIKDPNCVADLRSTKGMGARQRSFDDRAWLALRRD
jgi:hypothetical protein